MAPEAAAAANSARVRAARGCSSVRSAPRASRHGALLSQRPASNSCSSLPPAREVPLYRALSAAAQLVVAPRTPSAKGRAPNKVKRLSQAGFSRIPNNIPDESALPAPWDELQKLNRYPDVIPNAHSRVSLERLGLDPLSEYINANHVRGVEGSGRSYIAAQGPTAHSVADFWRMVWEQGSTAIVMLTGLIEGGRLKCERYWPAEVGPRGEVRHGDLIVRMDSSQSMGSYIRSVFRISRVGADGKEEERCVHHFWYNTWPDHGTPDDTAGVLALLQDVQMHSRGDESEPWVVHCSAGIGRTGTFIAIDMGAFQLASMGYADVGSLIRAMRQDRGGMVQTPVQADFVHRALVVMDVDAVTYPAGRNGRGG